MPVQHLRDCEIFANLPFQLYRAMLDLNIFNVLHAVVGGAYRELPSEFKALYSVWMLAVLKLF